MESETQKMQNDIDECKLKELKIILNQKFNINQSKNIYDFFELFKIRVLNQIIYENKYFNGYKKLYSLRNIYLQASISKYKAKLLYNVFYYWNIKAKIIKLKYNIKYKKNFEIYFSEMKKRNILINIVVKAIIKNEKINNVPIAKNYFLLYLKYYKCIIDNYYIKSITIVKAIYNYIRKKLKIYKAIFFSKIDYNIKNNECIYVYKYILSNYISDKTIQNNNDKIKNAISLLDNCNNIIKIDLNEYIKLFYKKNNIYLLLDKFVINKFFINKYLSRFFSIWKRNTTELSFIFKINSKENLSNDLMFSKLYLLIIILKKKIQNYFKMLFYKSTKNKQNKLLTRIRIESRYNNILFNVLKGINCLQNFHNIQNSNIYKLNNDIKKIIILKKWKKEKNIICNYNYDNIFLPNINTKILEGIFIYDSFFLAHDYKRISSLINILLKNYLNNINKNSIRFNLHLFLQIIQYKIINIKRKIIFRFLFEIFKNGIKEMAIKSNISFLISVISKKFSSAIFNYKIVFLYKLKYNFPYLEIKESQFTFKNNHSNSKNKDKIKKRIEKINNKLLAASIYMKYYQRNNNKNHYLYSLQFCFIHWSTLIGIFPSFLSNKENISQNIIKEDKEDEEEIKNQKNEIKELQKSLKEDKDFQHDLKAKISALDEENNFVNEKIFEITQRVEKCDKCNNLIKSSYISENKLHTSINSLVKNMKDEETINNKSRNPIFEKEKEREKVKDITSGSGFNFVSAGTELIPKKPRGYSKNDDIYESDSVEIDDEKKENEKDKKENNQENKNFGDTESFKEKILKLKREKDPIVNKLKEEILELYQELNVD